MPVWAWWRCAPQKPKSGNSVELMELRASLNKLMVARTPQRQECTTRKYPIKAPSFLPKLVVSLLLFACVGDADDRRVYDAELMQQFDANNARQGVAVDAGHFYAVNNFEISKHDKSTGKAIAQWAGRAEGEPLIHLDSLMELDGRLYASHSNYPVSPMTSSVEVWDARTMQHVSSYSFGIGRGSLTWLDRHDGFWWATFANYDKVQDGQTAPYGHTDNTQVVKLDDDFRIMQAWTLPLEILDRMRPMSNSGGSWGPDGMLYLTGHDLGEIYVMRIPDAGSILTWVATVRIPALEGQGIAWDRSMPGRYLWAINKGDRKVLTIRVPEIGQQ
jgi:hypothetical protein